MGYVDKTLECVECGTSFTFDASEQEFYANKGFTNEPKRCPTCRQARKQRSGYGYGMRPREMHTATCATCGKDALVPFQPREGRPVYCSDCYAQVRQ
jgi:CxxC-x17-CxxC domain-containing protein